MGNDKIKVHWVTLDQAQNAVANGLGYNVHNSQMKKYCSEYFEYCEDAPIALTITPADQFKPIPGKFNILFTMWESIDVPKSYLPGLWKADLIIVPSTFCQDIFRPLTNKPVRVCFEGVEPETFTFKERTAPDLTAGEKFRFLWLGAPNPRKGYFSIMELTKLVEKMPKIELYIKTTAHKKPTLKNLIKATIIRFRKMILNKSERPYWINWNSEFDGIKGSLRRFLKPEVEGKVFVMGKNKNIIMDTRKLPVNELVDLYHSAHCFLSPHSGEGWGLTLCEAMATGCPSVASYSTGVLDFLTREVGYPVKCNIVPVEMQNYEITSKVYVPDTKDFIEKTFDVLNNYREAIKRGKKASYRIRTEFTWKKSAKRMRDIVVSEFYKDATPAKQPELQEACV